MATLSAFGRNRRQRTYVLHDCGEKVRLGADGWGFCPECRVEFNGANCWTVPRP